jgi:hypothetical protein
VREAKGESIRLPEELWAAAGEHQEKRREVDAWEDLIGGFVEGVATATSGRQQVTADALWGAVGVPMERRDRAGARRISEIMQRLGFSRTNVREKERVMTGYVRQTSPTFIVYEGGAAKPPEDM